MCELESARTFKEKLLAFNVAGAIAVAPQPVEENSAQGQFEDERFDRSKEKEKSETRFFSNFAADTKNEKKMIFPVYLFFYCYGFYRGGEREVKRKTNKRRARRKACENVE